MGMLNIYLTVVISVLAVCLCGCVAEGNDASATVGTPFQFQEKFFEQKIDHFNSYWKSYGKQTFMQRYLVQDKWWVKGVGPIFFYAGNEGDIEQFWNNTGFMFEIAPKFKALVLFAEHRFYGKSLPFGGTLSFKQPYISLLSFEQALVDYASLLVALMAQLDSESVPVVSFGGSYGGMLSAYMRVKYPGLITGSIAASAPVLLVSGEMSRDFFFSDVTEDFRKAGCGEQIEEVFRSMNEMAKTAAGVQKLSEVFNLCKPLDSQKSYFHMQAWLRNVFTVLSMMDYPYPTDFMAQMPAWPVNAACKIITSNTSYIQNLAQVANLVYPIPATGCHDMWSEYVDCADPTGCFTGSASLTWDYQACTDFTMPSGSNNKTDMFPNLPFTIQDRLTYCQNKWNVTPDNELIRLSYSKADFARTGNIVFSNGGLDPWHRGGVMGNLSETVVAVFIEEGAHHLDLRGSNPADPPSVIKAREIEIEHINNWIKQHKLQN